MFEKWVVEYHGYQDAIREVLEALQYQYQDLAWQPWLRVIVITDEATYTFGSAYRPPYVLDLRSKHGEEGIYNAINEFVFRSNMLMLASK